MSALEDAAERGRQEGRAFDAALRDEERALRDARIVSARAAAGPTDHPREEPAFASSVHPSDVRALVEFRQAVLGSRGWRFLQSVRRLVGRAW